jgi:hypothetical protein
MKRFGVWMIVAVVGSATFATQPASGVAILDRDKRQVNANLLVYEDPLDPAVLSLPAAKVDEAPDTDDYNASIFTGANHLSTLGYRGTANIRARTAYTPTMPAIGTSFEQLLLPEAWAFALIEQTNDAIDGQAQTSVANYIGFTLTEPTAWSWAAEISGAVTGVGTVEYYFGFSDPNAQVYQPIHEQVLTGNFNQTVQHSGVLPAGQWDLVILLDAESRFAYTTGLADAYIELYNGVFRIPEPTTAALLATALPLLLRRRAEPAR